MDYIRQCARNRCVRICACLYHIPTHNMFALDPLQRSAHAAADCAGPRHRPNVRHLVLPRAGISRCGDIHGGR